MSELKVNISTPDKRLVEEELVNEIYFPGGFGVIGVFPGHTPLMTTVGTGIVVYTQGDVATILTVTSGVAEVTGTSVTMLVDVAEEASSIDVERAKKALDWAEGRLSGKELDIIELKKLEAAKARALARIEAAELHKTKGNMKDKK